MSDVTRLSRAQWAVLALLSLVYAVAGWAHLDSPDGFLAITPEWVPYPAQVIYWTGIAEIAGAIGLWVNRLRPAAAIGLALYAVCVWPANINHAINGIAFGGATLSWAYHGPRLLLQPVLIWAPLWASGLIDWPFKRRV
jgi:uncharacterized membrane protein